MSRSLRLTAGEECLSAPHAREFLGKRKAFFLKQE